MEHARKMALVDPRLLETLRSPPPHTDTVGKVMQGLDVEMTSILDQKDLNDGDKVKLYNQVLQRYNHLSDRRDKQPTRVVVVNDDATTETATPEKPTAAAPATAAPSAVEADIVDSVPKTMKVKANKLMDRLKTQLSWTDRGELIQGGTPVPGSNMVDLVNDVLVDDLGEVLDGTFYEPELQKVLVSKDKLYRVESVLQRRNGGVSQMIRLPYFVQQLDRCQGARSV